MLNLEPAKAILRSLLDEFGAIEKLRHSIFDSSSASKDEVDNSASDQDFWTIDRAYRWIYADPWYYHSLMLNQKNLEELDYYSQPALPLYIQ